MSQEQPTTSYMSDESIEKLLSVKKRLELLDIYLSTIKDKEKNTVVNINKSLIVACEQIKQILKCECRHEYVEDDIDIDVENSKKITYCPFCETTF
jgi:acetone carboxylase gamma subunit